MHTLRILFIFAILLLSDVHAAQGIRSRITAAAQRTIRTALKPFVSKPKTDTINGITYALIARMGEGVDREVYKAREIQSVSKWTGITRLKADTVVIKTQTDMEAHNREIWALGQTGDLIDHSMGQTHHKIVQKYHEGVPVADALTEARSDFRTHAKVIEAARNAIAQVHELGIYHGDAHTCNILYMNDGTAKMIDFGQSEPLPQSPSKRQEKIDQDYSTFDYHTRW
jgi:RIO-like serine/threonine protein kinase